MFWICGFLPLALTYDTAWIYMYLVVWVVVDRTLCLFGSYAA